MNKYISQFAQLMLVQLREFYREPEVLFWSIAFPVLMAWVLGLAFSGERQPVRNVAWVMTQSAAGHPDSAHSYIIRKFGNNQPATAYDPVGKSLSIMLSSKGVGKSQFKFMAVTELEAMLLVKRGVANLIVHDSGDSLLFHLDPKNADGYVAYLQIDEAMHGSGEVIQNATRIEKLETKGMRYIDFLIPGLLATNIMNSCLWGICYSLIEKRSKKLLRRMVATPMSKWLFLGSYILGRILLGLFEAVVLMFFAWLYFGCVMEGSLAVFLLVYLAGNVCFSGIGVLLSIRTAKPQIGNGLISLIQLPMMICSGVFFSYHSFPDALIPVIKLLPLTMLADSIRSIFVEGAGLASVLPATGLMTVLGMILFSIGLKLYKWY